MVASARPEYPRAENVRSSRNFRPIASMVAVGLVVAGIGVATNAVATGVTPVRAGAATAAATYAAVPPAVPVPSAPSLAVVAPVTTGLSPFDSTVLDAINAQRTAAGIAPLIEARGIDARSFSWSNAMATAGSSGTLSHNPQGWQTLLTSGASARTTYGENVSSWTGSPVTGFTLTNALVGNASNKNNILDPSFKYVGIGTVNGAAGSQWDTVTFTDAVDPGQIYDPALKSIPVGQLNSATLVGSTVRVTGWGYDPDTAAGPIQIQLSDTAPDGTVVTTTVTAAAVRTDVPQLTATTGNAHGLDATLPISKRGIHQICATLINAGAGSTNPNLGCLPVEVTGPIGGLDSAVLTGSTISFAGWAVDPDGPTTPTTVTVTDQGPQGTVTLPTVTADQVDANVDTSIPGVGAAHGFLAQTAATTVGTHVLCATANSLAAPARPTALGCQSVTVAAPAGAITGTTNTTNSVTVNGWALDPNAVGTASTVRVQITGPGGPVGTPSVVTASAVGTASAQQFPAAGTAHSFSLTVPTRQFGTYQVCAVANSTVDPSAGTDLGCQQVSISNVLGWLDSVKSTTGGLQVRGWALDPAYPSSAGTVSITVTGQAGTRTFQATAAQSRPDVARAFPGVGNYHGVVTSVPASGSGSNTVCLSMKAMSNQTVRQYRCLVVLVP